MSSTFRRNSYTFTTDDAVNVKAAAYKFGTTDQRVTLATASTDVVVGFCQDEVGQVLAAGDALELNCMGGGAKGVAHGTITRGQELMWDGTGLVAATTTNWVCAIALASAVSGDIFSIYVTGYHKV